MRVIAGSHRRRQLLAPSDSKVTRPITDRVKTSLFDRLAASGIFAAEPSVLDLFSGTGSLGIEALSRGAGHCTFVERDRAALQLLAQNIENLNLRRHSNVLPCDAFGKALPRRVWPTPVQLVFCDPPYRMTVDPDEMGRVTAMIERLGEITARHGLLVLRTSDQVDAPTVAGWDGPASHNYGSMTLHFYRKAESPTPGDELD